MLYLRLVPPELIWGLIRFSGFSETLFITKTAPKENIPEHFVYIPILYKF